MRYDESDRESSNVEDRRGRGGGGFSFPGGRGGIPIPIGGRGGLSFTTILIIGAIMLLFGLNPLDLLRGGIDMSQIPQMPRMDPGQLPTGNRSPGEIQGLPGQQAPASKGRDEMRVFTARVLADTEDVWARVFQSLGQRYSEPQLVIFEGQTSTACGRGQAAMGPFYCPLDRKVYIDLRFYEELRRRFRAPGDFAQAYVIAHEVGHHVQNILGILERVQQLKQRYPREANQIQVRAELQADCLAGMWASLNHQMKNRLQPGDVEEGLQAAAAIGDDMLQKQTQGYVVPESFTHGSSAQRVRWFKRGFESGKLEACDTFNTREL